MDKLQKADFFMNVVLPIGAGVGIYGMANHHIPASFTRNQLPDGLWAWSLFSCLLIIWERRIHSFWIAMAFVFCVGIELLQHCHIISGVGDYLDVGTYCMSGTIALLANKFFCITFKYAYDNQH